MRGISKSGEGGKGLFSNYECTNSLTLTQGCQGLSFKQWWHVDLCHLSSILHGDAIEKKTAERGAEEQ